MTDAAAAFRLTVLNPGGRDPEQHFPDGAGVPGIGHPPTNFHGYAACTHGSFHRDVGSAIAADAPVLLLLRGDFREAERALSRLQSAGIPVAVSLKETGLHQIANQLRDTRKLARFISLVRAADGCLGATPEAAEFYRTIRGNDGRVAFIATPYPTAEDAWNFSIPTAERTGLFLGTREFGVPSRNHLAALSLARELGETTGEFVTVYNFDGRRGQRLLDALGFASNKLRVLNRQLEYSDYLRAIATHRIVLQLDTSFVPGQVAGDAALARVPCVGGNGAIDRLAFPELSGYGRAMSEVGTAAKQLLTDDDFYLRQVELLAQPATSVISFERIAEALRQFFGGLIQAKAIASK